MSDPQFKHTCQECVFLGPYKHGEQEYDLYLCQFEGHTILSARYSDAVTHYVSVTTAQLETPFWALGLKDADRAAIWQARRQARIQKLIPIHEEP